MPSMRPRTIPGAWQGSRVRLARLGVQAGRPCSRSRGVTRWSGKRRRPTHRQPWWWAPPHRELANLPVTQQRPRRTGEERGPLTITKNPSDDQADNTTACEGTADGWELCTPDDLLMLTVVHPAVGVCVVTVDGELDTLSAPLLDACVGDQLTASPTHLILDLQPVCFLGSKGLSSLLSARELAQTTGTQLHLAGLVNRVVARPLQVTQLLEQFDTYPTLTDALAARTD